MFSLLFVVCFCFGCKIGEGGLACEQGLICVCINYSLSCAFMVFCCVGGWHEVVVCQFFLVFFGDIFTAWVKNVLTGELLCFIVFLVYIYLCWTPHLSSEKSVACHLKTC